ncbi:MAG: hypothetical protein PHH84_00930, partial [Oscillospiraceae bacterium]|nr:hypothetical protein [Oscillospiraceae bacterium]
MKNRLFASLLLVFMLTFLFTIPVSAYLRTEESSTGYPYDKNNKYNYYVANYGLPAMAVDGNNRIFTFNITVRDKKNVILSRDKLLLTMKNLPSQEYVTVHERMSGSERMEHAGYQASVSLPSIYSSGDWKAYTKKMIESRKDKGITIKEGSFMGKKALIEVEDEMNSDYRQIRTRSVSGRYFVYFDDIVIPNGIIVLAIEWRAVSFGWIGYSMPEKRQEVETIVSEKYEIVKSDVMKSLDKFSSIKFEPKKIAQVRIFKDKKQTANTNAATTAGTVAVAVLSTIISAAAISAGGAAGAAGGSGESGDEEEREKKSYKMVLYKEFGDKIKYNGETVFVYAKMMEVSPDGTELDRLDLTQRIEIFSDDRFLDISPPVLSGEYMGASVSATANQTQGMPSEGVISFRFNGEGGVFQNNVKFKMIGECYIELAQQNLNVYATSGGSFSMPYRLVDFANEANVEVLPMQSEVPFTLEIGVDKNNNPIIIASDTAEQKPIENFYDSFSCEITAKNDKESARTVFYVVMCYEGVLPDFLGKEKEIKGFKDDKGNMEKTLIAFSQGLWND